ncbi:MAG TPA: pseudouridine-5'-phosphate glycosidase [Clostridia bacterium]|nr:pseudouridine-5'-phosphate glycosidase [Clostridia bacterium]
MRNNHILLSDEVSKALQNKTPVVALESTIISHGMPYPQNVETAKNCEHIVRENGATPATCAILGGKLCVGINDEQLAYLGTGGEAIAKASRRDIPVLVAQKRDGATTVSGTMLLASMAGIQVMGTGGIGGVHRGAETTMDISADLEELGKTPVAVVCAGAKSILDLGLTLEYLETRGVPILGYQTDELPAFYTRKSDFKIDRRIDSPEEIAAVVRTQRELNYAGGILIVNPIPEAYSMDKDYINGMIEKAVEEAKRQGVHGKDVTPFLLAAIKDATGGKSLAANIELVYSNVALAAKIAASM